MAAAAAAAVAFQRSVPHSCIALQYLSFRVQSDTCPY
jgi:hypothetical protein